MVNCRIFGTHLSFAKTRQEFKKQYAIVDIVNEMGFDSVCTCNWWCFVLYVIVLCQHIDTMYSSLIVCCKTSACEFSLKRVSHEFYEYVIFPMNFKWNHSNKNCWRSVCGSNAFCDQNSWRSVRGSELLSSIFSLWFLHYVMHYFHHLFISFYQICTFPHM